MSTINTFGLVGRTKSGKDTFYLCCLELFLEQKIKVVPVRFAFADKLKEDLAVTMNLPGAYEVERRKNEPDIREALQLLGDKVKEKNKNFLLDYMKEKLRTEPVKHAHFKLFTDVRFFNEAEYIKKELGGVLIRLRRKEADGVESTHVSETELEKIPTDNIVYNNDSKLRFKMEVLDLLKQYGY